jgi:Secretion system C-terminal sorting domain
MKKALILFSTLFALHLQAQKETTKILITDGNGDNTATTASSSTPCLSESPNSDKATPINVCDKSPINIFAFGNAGKSTSEIMLPNSALKETHTTWLQYSIAKAGAMTFSIIPNSLYDDIDFVLYKQLPNLRWEIIRAATNGPMLGGEKPIFYKGNTTGMEVGDPDQFTNDGAGKAATENSDNDGFTTAVNVAVGEKYLLAINNFADCNGFRLAWTGTFSIQPCPIGVNIGNKVQKTIDVNVSEAFPNPSNEYINLDIFIANDDATTKEPTDIYLIDILGRIQSTQKLSPQKGESRITFDTQHLSPGMYHIQTNIKGERYIRKFVIQ